MNNSYSCILKDIAEIRSGSVLSKTANENVQKLTNTFVTMLQTSDFDEDGNISKKLRPNAMYKPNIEKSYLTEGDVLFNAKGRRFFAVVYNGQYNQTVAGSSFLILKVKNKTLTPDYLAWFLNHPETLKTFEIKILNQTMPMVTKKELEVLEIMIPSLEAQRNIVELVGLNKRKRQIQQKLITLNEKLVSAITYQKIKNEQ